MTDPPETPKNPGRQGSGGRRAQPIQRPDSHGTPAGGVRGIGADGQGGNQDDDDGDNRENNPNDGSRNSDDDTTCDEEIEPEEVNEMARANGNKPEYGINRLSADFGGG